MRLREEVIAFITGSTCPAGKLSVRSIAKDNTTSVIFMICNAEVERFSSRHAMGAKEL
jgi:hypothetical protein